MNKTFHPVSLGVLFRLSRKAVFVILTVNVFSAGLPCKAKQAPLRQPTLSLMNCAFQEEVGA